MTIEKLTAGIVGFIDRNNELHSANSNGDLRWHGDIPVEHNDPRLTAECFLHSSGFMPDEIKCFYFEKITHCDIPTVGVYTLRR